VVLRSVAVSLIGHFLIPGGADDLCGPQGGQTNQIRQDRRMICAAIDISDAYPQNASMGIASLNKMENKITWEKEFSLITNRFILKDLFKVVFITTVIFQILLVLAAFLVDKDVADMIMPSLR
jgi:hypothetical protein